ncbi:DUF4198 domain-containing protein [Pseudorhodoferax sp.]|uniref:DUF4198 domain-containing protein n=1 Tax=Pseudorhodoferax sp. TaxID=1993553 RepID=UPI002DD639C4|nr:DUF4198 domain-containing protein [Pseudorhodoferax sp.]
MTIFPRFTTALLALLLLPAQAHDAWIESRGDGFAVVFGHSDEQTEFAADKVRSALAFDEQGRRLAVQQRPADKAVLLQAERTPALWVLHFDNGYWSKPPGSTTSQNRPRTEVPGATTGTHAVKFGKTVLAWAPVVMQAHGQRLEIVPLTATAPAAGQALPVQVLWDGKPLAQAKLVREGAPKGTPPVETDAHGKALVPVAAGRQMISVAQRVDLRDEPRADVYSAAANLVFSAR